MRRFAFATMLFVATPALAHAQASTQQRIEQAIQLYEAFNVEAARPILAGIVSASYLQQVTAEQRATAYKYLGASLAVILVRNPVHAALWLVLAFVTAAGLWLLLYAEFLAVTLVPAGCLLSCRSVI